MVQPAAQLKYRLAANGSVVDTAPGPVTIWDKAKGYYSKAISIIGAVLVLANIAAPIFHGSAKDWITGLIAGLTIVLQVLKKDEKWFDALPL